MYGGLGLDFVLLEGGPILEDGEGGRKDAIGVVDPEGDKERSDNPAANSAFTLSAAAPLNGLEEAGTVQPVPRSSATANAKTVHVTGFLTFPQMRRGIVSW